ncbi:MAG: acyl-CoA thioesterase [Gammaproteobacteria bacterium]
MQKVTLPTDKELTMRVVPMPKDTNEGGSIFGGYIFSQIDIAASIPAVRRARGRVATVAVNSIELHQPVFVGDVLSLYAQVAKVGRTSVTVDVEVYAERNAIDPEVIKVTHATLTFVALDENRKPRRVPVENSAKHPQQKLQEGTTG